VVIVQSLCHTAALGLSVGNQKKQRYFFPIKLFCALPLSEPIVRVLVSDDSQFLPIVAPEQPYFAGKRLSLD